MFDHWRKAGKTDTNRGKERKMNLFVTLCVLEKQLTTLEHDTFCSPRLGNPLPNS